jgi:hypothetical protein
MRRSGDGAIPQRREGDHVVASSRDPRHQRAKVKRVTQRIDPKATGDLLKRVPRAHVAFVDGGRLEATPVAFRFHQGRYWIGLARSTPALQLFGDVALTIDEGWYWFELRAVCIRGVVMLASQSPDVAAASLDWFEVLPKSVTAWDYGTLHEEDINAAR